MRPLRSAADSPGRGTQAALTARGTHVRVNSGGEYQSRLPEWNLASATRPSPQISGTVSNRVRASPSVLSLIRVADLRAKGSVPGIGHNAVDDEDSGARAGAVVDPQRFEGADPEQRRIRRRVVEHLLHSMGPARVGPERPAVLIRARADDPLGDFGVGVGGPFAPVRADAPPLPIAYSWSADSGAAKVILGVFGGVPRVR